MGKSKGKIVMAGKPGTISYKNDAGQKLTIEFDQPFYAELGIVVDARVSFNIVNVGGKDKAVCVNNVNKGVINEIDASGNSGSILDSNSGEKYPFMQDYLAESQIVVGSAVQYVLVNSNNTLYAACIEL